MNGGEATGTFAIARQGVEGGEEQRMESNLIRGVRGEKERDSEFRKNLMEMKESKREHTLAERVLFVKSFNGQ